MVNTSGMCMYAAVLLHTQHVLVLSSADAFVTSPPAGRSVSFAMTHSSSKVATTITAMSRDMQGCGESAAWGGVHHFYGYVVQWFRVYVVAVSIETGPLRTTRYVV